MREVFICDAARTAIGRYGGALARVRTDDIAAAPIRALVARNAKVDWSRLDEVFFGCANQAGEDNRNIARMALLLAGLPDTVPGVTVNRLCGSGLDAVATRRARSAAAKGLRHRRRRRIHEPRALGDAQGERGVFAHRRDPRHDHRLALRQSADSGPLRRRRHAGNGRECRRGFQVARQDQGDFALRSQQRAGRAKERGFLAREIVRVNTPGGKAARSRGKDEHPRPETTLETWRS